MKQVSVGYLASVTESEAGWGTRSDGWVIGWDKPTIDAWIKANSHVISGDRSEYSFIDGPFELVKLTQLGKETIESYINDLKAKPDGRPFVWLFKDINKYVER